MLAFAAAAVMSVAALAPVPAMARTAPTAAYTMSKACSGSECRITITPTTDPSDYVMRAWIECTNSKFYYGPAWITSGTSVATCGGGDGYIAGFEYDRTHQYQVLCWAGGAKNGSC